MSAPPPYAWPHPVDEMEIPQEIFDLGVSNYTRGFLGDTIECGLGSDFIIVSLAIAFLIEKSVFQQNGDGIPYRAWGVSMFKYELWPGVAR